jgi:hypothetical protein
VCVIHACNLAAWHACMPPFDTIPRRSPAACLVVPHVTLLLCTFGPRTPRTSTPRRLVSVCVGSRYTCTYFASSAACYNIVSPPATTRTHHDACSMQTYLSATLLKRDSGPAACAAVCVCVEGICMHCGNSAALCSLFIQVSCRSFGGAGLNFNECSLRAAGYL